MRKDTLTTQKARLIKEMLWKGKEQARIAAVTGVSQATVSRIKKGMIQKSVPWPDGTLGALPRVSTVKIEEGWSADTQHFLSYPQDMQDRILAMVNERRAAIELPPIPPMASAYAEYLTMEDEGEEAEVDGLVDARVEEDKRISTIVEEFNAIIEENLSSHRDSDLMHAIESTQAVNTNPLPPSYEGPPRYVALPWSSVIAKDPTNPLVREAVGLGCPVRIEAICIVFNQVAQTRESWRADAVRRLVDDTERRLYEHTELIEKIKGASKIGTEGKDGEAGGPPVD